MQINTPTLIIEIKNSEYIFVVGENNEDNNFKLLYKNIIQTSLTNDNPYKAIGNGEGLALSYALDVCNINKQI